MQFSELSSGCINGSFKVKELLTEKLVKIKIF